MKMSENTKYEYWKWILLQKHTKLINEKAHRNIVAVYNPTKNIIFRFDINKGKKIKSNWEGFEWLLERYTAKFVEIRELEQFYKSLPKKYKDKFWDFVGR